MQISDDDNNSFDLHKGDTDLTTIVISKWKCSTKVLKYQLNKTFNRSSYQLSLVRIQTEKASWQTAGMKWQICCFFVSTSVELDQYRADSRFLFIWLRDARMEELYSPKWVGPCSKWIYLFSHLPYRWQNPLFNSFVCWMEETKHTWVKWGKSPQSLYVNTDRLLVLASLVASSLLDLFNKLGTLQLHPRSTDPFLIGWELGGVRYCQDADGWQHPLWASFQLFRNHFAFVHFIIQSMFTAA